MKRVFIIPGRRAMPESNWFPWAKQELEKHGFEVAILAMPTGEALLVDNWLKCMHEHISNPDGDTYFIGHSVGCVTILHYLQSLPESTRVGGAILVAGFAKPIGMQDIASFTNQPLDFEKIKTTTSNFVVVHSDNDPHVAMHQAEALEKDLEATLVIMSDHHHFSDHNGITQLPIVIEELLHMAE